MEYRKVSTMSGEKTSNPDDLRNMLADYLGGELDPRKRAEFERAMQNDPELAMEVTSLQSALDDLRLLDYGEEAVRTAQVQEQTVSSSRRGVSTLRFAAMIGLAFVVGYVLRGMEPQPLLPPTQNGNPNAERQVDNQSPSQEDFPTRLARHYLDQPGRSGFGRSLIAYARTAQGTSKKN